MAERAGSPLRLRQWDKSAPREPAIDPASRVDDALERALADQRPSGRRVAVGLGSRALPGHAAIARAVVRGLVARGAAPVIIPAMGSHGGDAAGQLAILARQGIDAATLGAPIDASMATVVLGTTPNGVPIHWSSAALSCDFTLLVNRVAEHPRLIASLQSGLNKMSAIGLGKLDGARTLHAAGLAEQLGPAGELVRRHANLAGGLALLCGDEGQPVDLVGLGLHELPDGEAALLGRARRLRPRLPLAAIDVLALDWFGKDVSPTGIDRRSLGRADGADPVRIGAVVALGLTPASGGNGLGVGFADAITRRVLGAIDERATRHNAEGSGDHEACAIARTFADDAAALAWARDAHGPGLVRVESTARLRRLLCADDFEPPGYTPGPIVACEFDREGHLDRESPWRLSSG